MLLLLHEEELMMEDFLVFLIELINGGLYQPSLPVKRNIFHYYNIDLIPCYYILGREGATTAS